MSEIDSGGVDKMTDDKGAGEGPVKREPLRMRAYYYSFSETGNCEIDRILSAVACAGKVFHNTDCWNDECDPYSGHVGITPIDWIQNAANDCAIAFKSAYEDGRKAGRASRDGLREELMYVKGYCNCASTRSIEKALEADGEGDNDTRTR